MNRDRATLVLAAGLLAILASRSLAVQPAGMPVKVPATDAEPWMADALPGVGPKRLAAALADLRSGAWERLPAQARPEAWFLRPVAGGSGGSGGSGE